MGWFTSPKKEDTPPSDLVPSSSGANAFPKPRYGPFMTWATVDADDLVILAGREAIGEYKASNGVRRFCLKCGTPLSFQRGDLPEEVDITLSSMDDCDWQPEMHIWHSAAVTYCRVVDHAPGHHPLPRHAEDPATLLRKNQQEL